MKKGITLKQLEAERKKIKLKTPKKMDLKYYVETTFHFKCPRCQERNTKRTGTTSQISPKARILCYTCRELSKKLNPTLEDDKKIKPFFTLTYEQMKKEIEESNIDDEKKKFFLEKYKI